MPATINFILYCTGEPSVVRQDEEIQVRNIEMEETKLSLFAIIYYCKTLLRDIKQDP